MVHKAKSAMSAGDFAKKFIFITLGAILMAIALEVFLVPNDIIDGGITGISIVLSKLLSIKLGILIFLINLPFLYIGLKQIGHHFAISAIYGVTVMSVFTLYLHRFDAFTDEKLLAVLYGGILLGLGVGLVIRFGGALDGTEVVAILLSKKLRKSVGQVIMMINVVIFIVAGFVLGADSAMYSIVTFYIAAKVMDIVVEGLDESKSVTIISTEHEQIVHEIQAKLGRSATLIYAKGGYSREDIQIVYCVVTRLELVKLKELVQDVDPHAFISISQIADVMGGSLDTSKPR